jgi:hypothetical protein
MPTQVTDKASEPIKEGEEVWTPFRGGKHQGEVERVVTTTGEAKEEDVKNPPKVYQPGNISRLNVLTRAR